MVRRRSLENRCSITVVITLTVIALSMKICRTKSINKFIERYKQHSCVCVCVCVVFERELWGRGGGGDGGGMCVCWAINDF